MVEHSGALVPQPRSQDLGGTHQVPGRWGCGRALRGRLQTGRPWGPRMRLGRCGAQSGSSAPRGRWQPGHRGGCSEAMDYRTERTAPSPQLPLLQGLPERLPSPALLFLSPSILSPSPWCFHPRSVGTNRPQGGSVQPGARVFPPPKRGVHNLSAHIPGTLRG